MANRPRVSICIYLFISLTLYLLVPIKGSAQQISPGMQSFMFYFSVNGYEPGSWFGEPSALALDEKNSLIYIADTQSGSVDAFSLQGVPKFRYGSKYGLKSPIGLAVDKQGNVYVSESDGGPIKIISPKGEVSTFELPVNEGEESPKPGRMTFDNDGNLYVIDRASCRIHAFDKERKLRFKLGGIGDKRGEFKLLQDVAVDRQGRIYALDSIGIPVQVFDRSGKFIYRFGLQGEGKQNLSFPVALFLDRHDQIWIVDRNSHSLKVFNRAGAFLQEFGSYGLGEGMIFHPIDAGADNFGRVYLLEAGARRLQVFSLSRPFSPLGSQGF